MVRPAGAVVTSASLAAKRIMTIIRRLTALIGIQKQMTVGFLLQMKMHFFRYPELQGMSMEFGGDANDL